MGTSTKKFITEVSRQLADKGLLIEAGWVGLKMIVPVSSEEEKRMRMAFFSGAHHLFTTIVDIMDGEDREPTDSDLKRMDLINDELMKHEAFMRSHYPVIAEASESLAKKLKEE